MEQFKEYRRTQISEMREVTQDDIDYFKKYRNIESMYRGEVSISDVDLKNGSLKIGDMIARNPKNHSDQWLVAKQYFEDNFETL